MRRWLQLPPKERRLVISAARYVGTAAIGVRVFGVRPLLKWADRPISAKHVQTKATEHEETAECLAVAVGRAGRYLPGGTCLARSLALTRMLRERGVAAETRIGVKTADGFHAHAWVEVDGVPLTRESDHQAVTLR